jgi:hypothetical protein
MTKPAQTHDDDGLDASMTLQDWIEVLDGDIDEAADGLKTRANLTSWSGSFGARPMRSPVSSWTPATA